MSAADALPSLVAIVGPTGAGKSAVAIEVAEQVGGEIVSADSRLLYRGMDIGTAKPSLADRARVPHHLIDVADPQDTWSLARFRAAAMEAFESIYQRGNLPLLVGGTGLYIRSLLEGWAVSPDGADAQARRGWETIAAQVGADRLYQMLCDTDPDSAARIDRRNVRRVMRALEVHQITGRPASQRPQRRPVAFRSRMVGLDLPRHVLYPRLDARLDDMFNGGLVDEVRRLLDQGVPPEAPSLTAIGYGEVVRHLSGGLTRQQAIDEARRRTRVLVRHQSNWFRASDPAIDWYRSGPGVADVIAAEIRRWLSAGAAMRH